MSTIQNLELENKENHQKKLFINFWKVFFDKVIFQLPWKLNVFFYHFNYSEETLKKNWLLKQEIFQLQQTQLTVHFNFIWIWIIFHLKVFSVFHQLCFHLKLCWKLVTCCKVKHCVGIVYKKCLIKSEKIFEVPLTYLWEVIWGNKAQR